MYIICNYLHIKKVINSPCVVVIVCDRHIYRLKIEFLTGKDKPFSLSYHKHITLLVVMLIFLLKVVYAPVNQYNIFDGTNQFITTITSIFLYFLTKYSTFCTKKEK